jgi:hypothetical protein
MLLKKLTNHVLKNTGIHDINYLGINVIDLVQYNFINIITFGTRGCRLLILNQVQTKNWKSCQILSGLKQELVVFGNSDNAAWTKSTWTLRVRFSPARTSKCNGWNTLGFWKIQCRLKNYKVKLWILSSVVSVNNFDLLTLMRPNVT